MPSDSGGPRLDPTLIKFLAYGTGAGLLGLVIWSLQGGTTIEKRPESTIPVADPAVAATGKPSKPWMTAEGRDSHGTWATLTVNGAIFRLRLIPAGSFRMGSPAGEPERSPTETLHQVTLTQAFWMSESEVSRSQWANVVTLAQGGDQLPQTGVSWIAADDFTKALNRAHPELSARLPTEAEWEYACRAGSPEAYANGPTVDAGEWLAVSDKGPRLIGKGVRNRFGLSDMHGNVREWCRDDWDGSTPLPSTEEFDPLNRQGSKAVVRGGSWLTPASAGRSAARAAGEPQDALSDVGVRFVVE
jgi:sulfatase modifying factor 1